MLTSWQKFIAHLPALLLYGSLGVAALAIWTVQSDLSKISWVATNSLFDSPLTTSSHDSNDSGNSPAPQALPSDESDDDSSNNNLNPNGQVNEARPDALVLLPPFEILGLLQLNPFFARSFAVLPSDPPPRLTSFLYI